MPDKVYDMTLPQLRVLHAELVEKLNQDHAAAPKFVGQLARVNGYIAAAQERDEDLSAAS